MAAETLKDFLIGVGFDVDEAGSAQAESVIDNLNAIVQQLGQVLMSAAESVKGLIDDTAQSTEAFDSTAEAIQSETVAAQENAEAVRESTEAHKEGTESVDEHGEAQEQAGKKAEEAGKQYKKADEAAKMKGAKEGASNVKNLDGQLKKASGTIKKFAAAAIAMLIGSGLKSAITETIKFGEELVKSAKSMNKTVEEARAYNTALKVMGKTAQEIEADDSLKSMFEDLQGIGQQLALPAAAEGVTTIRSLMDAFTQFKFVAQYALQWIMYKIQTVAEGPLAEVRDMLTGMRDWFAGNIEKIAEGIATAFGWIIQLITSAIKTVQSVISWIDKLPPSIKIVGAVALAVIAAIKSKTALITLIVTGILLLLDDLQTYLEGGDSLFGDFWGACIEGANAIAPVVDAAIVWIDSLLQKVGEILAAVVEGIGQFWQTLQDNGTLEKLQTIFENVFGIVEGLVNAAVDYFTKWFTGVDEGAEGNKSSFGFMVDAIAGVIDILATVIEWITSFLVSLGEIPGVMETIQGIIDTVAAVVQGAWEIIDGIIQAIIQLLNGDFSGAWNTIKDAAADAWNTIKEKAEGLWESLQTLFEPIAEWFSKIFGNAKDAVETAWDSVTDFFQNIWNGIVKGVSGIVDSIKQPFVDAWNAIEEIWGKVTGWFSGIFGGVKDDENLSGIEAGISNPFTNAWSAIETTFTGVKDTVTGWFSGIGEGVATAVGDIASWATDAWGTITDKLSGAAVTISGWFSGIDLGNIVSEVSGWASTAWNNITDAFGDVKGWFSETFSDIGEMINTAVGNVAEWASNTWQGVQDAASNVGGWFASLFGWGSEDDGAAAEAEAQASEAGSSTKEALLAAFEGADADVAQIFASMLTLSDASIGALVGAMELAASTISADVSGMQESMAGSMSEVRTDTDTNVASITTALDKIVTVAQKMVQGIISAIKGMPQSAKTIFSQLAASMVSSMTTAANNVVNLVNKIKAAINSIPKKINISGPSLSGHSEGGVIEHETISRLGEGNLREYVIPVMKPSRAIPLLRQAAADLGMTVDSAKHATQLLGGDPSKNITPAYMAGGGSTINNVTNNNYNNTVNSPVTQNITGTNDRSIADMASRNHEQIVLRNIKSVLA